MAKRTLANRTIQVNGRTICEIRKVLGLQAQVLAERVEISANYLSEIENGHKQPSPPVLKRLATALGVDVGALFCTLPKKASGSTEGAVRAS